MNRRTFLRSASVGTAAALGYRIRARPARPARKPNLVVFLPDQQRADTIACYGSGKNHAPNLNKLASQSVVFERAYVTHPVCTPSRSSLLTGLWPHQTGCTQNSLPLNPKFLCFPELLADSDYRTGYFGKWHLGDEVFPQRGFEQWVAIEDIYQEFFSAGRDRTAVSDYSRFLLSRGFVPDNKDGRSFSRKFASNLPIELSKPAFLEKHACDFLHQHRRSPFILFISFLEPHTPYNGPLNGEHRLDEIEFGVNATHTFGNDLPLRYRLRQEYQAMEYGRTLDDFRKTKQKYLGLVTEIDRSIGAILGQINALGLADDTIVVHTSDHGDMMGSHRLFEKEVMFQEATRVPYLIRMPGQRRTARIAQPVSQIDFIPTLLDLLGGPEHPQCSGRSRAALVRGTALPAENVYLEWSPNAEGVKAVKGTALATAAQIKRAESESTRTAVSPDGWKLCLRDFDRSEFYNLQADPGETTNVFGRASVAEAQRRLTAEIYAWQERTQDPLQLA